MKPRLLAPRNESSRGRRGKLFLLTLSLRVLGALFIFWLLINGSIAAYVHAVQVAVSAGAPLARVYVDMNTSHSGQGKSSLPRWSCVHRSLLRCSRSGSTQLFRSQAGHSVQGDPGTVLLSLKNTWLASEYHTTSEPKPEKGDHMRKWFRRFRKELSDQLWLLWNLRRINRELNEFLAESRKAAE